MIMSNETERTLHELKLPGMASCWSSLEETHQLDKLTLRSRLRSKGWWQIFRSCFDMESDISIIVYIKP